MAIEVTLRNRPFDGLEYTAGGIPLFLEKPCWWSYRCVLSSAHQQASTYFLTLNITGWWIQPWKSVGIIIPSIWKNKSRVPNHQPDYRNGAYFRYPCCLLLLCIVNHLGGRKGLYGMLTRNGVIKHGWLGNPSNKNGGFTWFYWEKYKTIVGGIFQQAMFGYQGLFDNKTKHHQTSPSYGRDIPCDVAGSRGSCQGLLSGRVCSLPNFMFTSPQFSLVSTSVIVCLVSDCLFHPNNSVCLSSKLCSVLYHHYCPQ